MPTSQIDWVQQLCNRLIQEQRNYDLQEQINKAQERIAQFNDEQLHAFNSIRNAVDNNTGQCFFLNGAGGCGKTFVYNTLCYHFHGQGKIVLCVASSGIAALLMMGGRTTHYRFKIPIVVHESSVCSINKNSLEAELLLQTSLILWDEALMQHRHIFDAVDRTLRDVLDVDKLFGGITVVFGGDYQQILPVIPKGSRAQIVAACLIRSHLFQDLEILQLKKNMRLGQTEEDK
jgi:PIF1-like helicase